MVCESLPKAVGAHTAAYGLTVSENCGFFLGVNSDSRGA